MSKESNAKEISLAYLGQVIGANQPPVIDNSKLQIEIKIQELQFALRAALVEMIDAKAALIECKRAFGDASVNRQVPMALGCIHGLATQISNAKKLLDI